MELKEKFSVKEMRKTMSFLSPLFDVVRVVDPVETKVLNLCEDGDVTEESYKCYDFWKKAGRCQNCTSECAMKCSQIVMKYEFLAHNVFYVVSRPIILEQNGGIQRKAVLEIASHVSEKVMTGQEDNEKTVKQMVEETERLIYSDPLTDAFNRRYLEERFSAQNQQYAETKRAALILLDVSEFKRINDSYGHGTGDDVLRALAHTLKENVRKEDAVIRMGGDEFLLVLGGCHKDEISDKVENLREKVQRIVVAKGETLKVDFGWTYTENLDGDPEKLKKLLRDVDEKMYQEKRSRKRRQ